MTEQLAAIALSVVVPTLMYAHVRHTTCGGTFLAVCRSPVVRDTDPAYQPVADVLEAFDYEVIDSVDEPDPGMMFGRSETTVYKLSEKDAA